MTANFQTWRLPAAAISVLLVALPLLMAGLWLHGAWKAGEETISDELAKFDRLRSVAAYRQALESADAGAGDKVYDDLFLKGGPAAVVSADLLTQLKQMAAAHGVEVSSTGDLPAKTEEPITLVGGSLEMSGTIPAIYGLVQQIEAAKPLLFIDQLNLRSDRSVVADDKNDTRLMVDIHVYGAVRSSTVSENGKVN